MRRFHYGKRERDTLFPHGLSLLGQSQKPAIGARQHTPRRKVSSGDRSSTLGRSSTLLPLASGLLSHSFYPPVYIYEQCTLPLSLYVASIRGNPRSLSRKSNDISIPERWHLAPNWGQLVAITKEERIQLGAAFYRNPRPRSLTTELHQKEEKKKEKSSCSCNVIAAVAVTVAVLVCGRSSGLESLMNSALTEKEDPTLVTFRSLSLPHLFAPFRVFCRRLYQAGPPRIRTEIIQLEDDFKCLIFTGSSLAQRNMADQNFKYSAIR